MENTELHGQKLAILSRLIKDSSLTLEEALVLLQDEPQEATIQTAPVTPHWNPWQNPIEPSLGQPWTSSGTTPNLGNIRFGTSTGSITLRGNGVITTSNTADADLNN